MALRSNLTSPRSLRTDRTSACVSDCCSDSSSCLVLKPSICSPRLSLTWRIPLPRLVTAASKNLRVTGSISLICSGRTVDRTMYDPQHRPAPRVSCTSRTRGLSVRSLPPPEDEPEDVWMIIGAGAAAAAPAAPAAWLFDPPVPLAWRMAERGTPAASWAATEAVWTAASLRASPPARAYAPRPTKAHCPIAEESGPLASTCDADIDLVWSVCPFLSPSPVYGCTK
mmetsp:Transcript_15511/g.44906  ORF Transcript_15511/g.44906 Transcript_15511/m.44906 type:complete len:226 (-) Transcript_15511:357-1034(-)